MYSSRLRATQPNRPRQTQASPINRCKSVRGRSLFSANGCNAIDAGVVLPGINQDYTGHGPVLGAYEIGAMLPTCGIRIVEMDGAGEVDGADLAALAHQLGT